MTKTIHRAAVLVTAMAVYTAAQSSTEAIVISQDFVVEGRVVKGVPYTAQAVTSVKQTLPTGSEILTQTTALVARDTEGRTRREQTIRAIGPWAVLSERGPSTVILIQDPVKQVTYSLDPREHLARILRQRPPQEIAAARQREAESRPAALPERREERREEHRESLGERVIEGVSAQGRRVVTILPAGAIGNSARLELVVETWYSPELQVVVLGRRNDPRVGEITYKLVNIKRGDPAASLFEVPSDYRVDGEPRRQEPRREER